MIQPCRHLARVGPINPGEVAVYPLEVAALLKRRGAVTFDGPPVDAPMPSSCPSVEAITGEQPAAPEREAAPAAPAAPASTPPSPRRFGKRGRR